MANDGRYRLGGYPRTPVLGPSLPSQVAIAAAPERESRKLREVQRRQRNEEDGRQ
jgi:hypothetical protein